VIMFTSLAGGLTAAAVTYYLFTHAIAEEPLTTGSGELPDAVKLRKTTNFNLMILGGQEAVQIIINTIPILVLAIFLVNIFKATGAIAVVETLVAPVFGLIGFPAVAVLPIVTKYMAGGTAMMGVMLNLLQEGAISVTEMNRMAGFLINPCDLVGVAILISAGNRCASMVRPALAGAVVGVTLRAVLHLLIF